VHFWAPASASRQPTPLVIVFHGAGGDGKLYLERNGWIGAAQKNGFIVIAPDGLPARPKFPPNFLTNPRLWNAANPREDSPRTSIDDVRFVEALLDDAARRWNVDRARIHAAGHSNGGALCFLLGARMATRLAAIAPVATLAFVANPTPARAIPTLYIVGRKDPIVPYEGGTARLPWGPRTSAPVEQSMIRWSKALGCAEKPQKTGTVDGVERRRYCDAFHVVIIDDHGHGWPGGGESGLREERIGPSTKKVDATAEIWTFFSRQPEQVQRQRD
jgi:polyhydroxybutyrate depolymerase